jgi:hypothetical protein
MTLHPHAIAAAVFALLTTTRSTGSESHSTTANFRCFPRQTLSFECEDQRDWDDAGDRMYLPLIRGNLPDGRHVYMLWRAVPIDVCRARLSRWRELVNQVDSTCLEGDPSGTLPAGERLWAWNRLTTSRGSDCYFCD